MSDKGKARKLEDRTKPRGLPIGGPGIVPHHNYTLPSDNFHSAGSRLPYRAGLGPMMGQSLPMGPSLTRVPSGLSNDYDLGPPIFMPSLNLGPKPPGTSNVPAPLPSSSLSNSKLAAGMSSSATAAFMPADMLTYHTSQAGAPFHSSALSGHVPPYMGGPHPSSKPSSSAIAKPTPISMGTYPGPKGPLTKVVPGQLDKDGGFTSAAGGKQLKSSPQGGVVKFLGTSEGGVKGDGLVLSQAYYSTPASVLNSPSTSLSRILAASSSPSPASQDPQPTMAASSPGSKPTSTATGSFAAVLTDAYAVRSPGMAPPTPATSGQPSSNATFADTRQDRPPQPSALQNPPVGVVPGKELNQQQLQGKERLTIAEVASNIIISNPGLTGKHIAAMTNSSTQSQPSHLPHSAYSSPIISQSSISSAQELLPHPLLLNQHMADTPPWGFPPHHNSNHMFHSPLSPPVSMTTGLGGGGGGGGGAQDIASSGNGLKSRLESPATSLAQSPQQGGSGPPGPGGGGGSMGEQGVPSSPSQVSSMRPRILRGKRSVDGNWKLEQQPNSLQNSPGSPHRTKLPSNLKKSVLASPAAVSASSGEQVPPTSPSMDGQSHPFNHVGGVNRLDPGTPDTSGSPRKKPRKQNVIANDDQYASNVPDTTQQQSLPLPLSQRQGTDEASILSPEDSKGRGGDVAGEGGGGSGKEVEVRYLSQLRQCPYPINGVYKLRHNTAHNHFRSPADIKHRETLPLSVYDLANAKSSQVRASGWKLFHFSSQLEEVCRVEGECLAVVEEIQRSLDTLTHDDSCLLDSEALRTTTDLLQGNVDRCNRVISHVESTKGNMFMVLDQKTQVLDVLDKYSNFKSYYSSISPSLSSASSNQHKSHS